MIRLRFELELDYQVGAPGCDFLFYIHAAHTQRQRVIEESLQLSQNVPTVVETDPVTYNRCLRLSALPGPLRVSYHASVELRHHFASPQTIAELPISSLPAAALGYLTPSRYCQSDRLLRLAAREFGHLPRGYARVQAINDWVAQRIRFTSNTSDSNTSAIDTLVDTVGVCRDFAHLMVALCRAVNVPARLATGVDYGADPALGPTDFHAYVEAYLGDRWYIFDPSGTAIPMGFVRFATGRDAADVAFATMFGPVNSSPPRISIEVLPGDDGETVMPRHRTDAISTDH